MPKVLVFGAGAIGSFLGYRLASAGHQVTLVGRPALVSAVQAHGLLLEDGSRTMRPLAASSRPPPRTEEPAKEAAEARQILSPGSCVVHPLAIRSVSELTTEERFWDLVLLTVKVYDTSEAAQALGPDLPAGTPVLIVQNGVGGEELTKQALPQASILSGALTMSVSATGPGQVRL